MANRCCFCGSRTDTNMLVLNAGTVWIEFCEKCGKEEKLTNADTGEVVTVVELFNRSWVKPSDKTEE